MNTITLDYNFNYKFENHFGRYIYMAIFSFLEEGILVLQHIFVLIFGFKNEIDI